MFYVILFVWVIIVLEIRTLASVVILNNVYSTLDTVGGGNPMSKEINMCFLPKNVVSPSGDVTDSTKAPKTFTNY